MTRRHWTISTELSGKTREIEVYLYDKVSHMRAAATRWDRSESTAYRIDFQPDKYDRALAVTHSFSRVAIAPDGAETPHPRVVILRLVRGFLTPEIVSHEVVHIAQHLYGLDMYERQGGAEHDHWNASNEPFAYLYGGLFAVVAEMLDGEE